AMWSRIPTVEGSQSAGQAFSTRGNMKKVIGALFLMLVAIALTAWAQAITGTIVGTVSDESGAVLTGVSVTAINTGTNLRRRVTTNESGNFSISNLQVGTYRMEAELAGFRKEVLTGITLQVDSRARINMVMK